MTILHCESIKHTCKTSHYFYYRNLNLNTIIIDSNQNCFSPYFFFTCKRHLLYTQFTIHTMSTREREPIIRFKIVPKSVFSLFLFVVTLKQVSRFAINNKQTLNRIWNWAKLFVSLIRFYNIFVVKNSFAEWSVLSIVFLFFFSVHIIIYHLMDVIIEVRLFIHCLWCILFCYEKMNKYERRSRARDIVSINGIRKNSSSSPFDQNTLMRFG